jgi:hypothetical protein
LWLVEREIGRWGGGARKRRSRATLSLQQPGNSTSNIQVCEPRVLLSAASASATETVSASPTDEVTDGADLDDSSPVDEFGGYEEDYADYNYEYLQGYADELQEGFEDPNAAYFEEAAYEYAEQAATYTSEFSDPYFTSEYADELFTSVDIYADIVDLSSDEGTAGNTPAEYEDLSLDSDDANETESDVNPIFTPGEASESAITDFSQQIADIALSSEPDSTATDSTTTEPAKDSREIAVPEELSLTIPSLPTEGSLSSLGTYVPLETFSFTTSVETAAPTVVKAITGEKTGNKVSDGSSTVTTDLVWVGPGDWTLTESRATTWTTTETTNDADGVDFVESESGSTGLTIVVSADGSFSLTSEESKSLSYSSDEDWNNSTAPLPPGVVATEASPNIVDEGEFSASTDNSLTRTVSIAVTPVTLSDGSAGVLTELGLSSTTLSSLSIGGNSTYGKDSGTITSPAPITQAITPGGNGKRAMSTAGIGTSASRGGSFGLSLSATTPVDAEITRDDITGTVTVAGASSLSASASSDFEVDDQTHSGSESNDTDRYLYVSFGLNGSVGFGTSSGIKVTADVTDPASATATVSYAETDTADDDSGDSLVTMLAVSATSDDGDSADDTDGGLTEDFIELEDDPDSGTTVNMGGGSGSGGGGHLSVSSRTRQSDSYPDNQLSVDGQRTVDLVKTVTFSVSGSGSSGGGYQVTTDAGTGDQVLKNSASASTSEAVVVSVESMETHLWTGTGYVDIDVGFPGPATVELLTIYHDLEKTSYSNDGTDSVIAAVALDDGPDPAASGGWDGGTAQSYEIDHFFITNHVFKDAAGIVQSTHYVKDHERLTGEYEETVENGVYTVTAVPDHVSRATVTVIDGIVQPDVPPPPQPAPQSASINASIFAEPEIGFLNGLKTGAKALINSTVDAGVSLVTLGQVDAPDFVTVDPNSDLGYGSSRLASDIAIGALQAAATGGLSGSAGMVGNVARGVDMIDNVGGIVVGAQGAVNNGVNPQNGLQMLGLLGASQLKAGDGINFNRKVGNEALEDATTNSLYSLPVISSNCFVAGTQVVTGHRTDHFLVQTDSETDTLTASSSTILTVAAGVGLITANRKRKQKRSATRRHLNGPRMTPPLLNSPGRCEIGSSEVLPPIDSTATEQALSAIFETNEHAAGRGSTQQPFRRSPILNSLTAAALAFLVLLGGWSWFSLDSGLPTSSEAVAAARPTNGTVNEHGLRTQSIETIRLGQRVVGRNPLRHETQPPSNITPEGWRAIYLTMSQHGVEYDLRFLRSVEWLHAQYARTGSPIHLQLPEMGLDGPALVQAINPCPPIESADGTDRMLVTGTMAHLASNVLDLSITGLEEPLGVTTTHPIWSETRQQFIKASNLTEGEQLRSSTNHPALVTKITPRRGPPQQVYNLEINGEHVYQVETTGLLVHNQCHHLVSKYGNLSRPAAAKAIADSKKILKDAGKSVEGKGLGNNIRKIDEHLPKQHSILYHESVRDHLKEVTKGIDPGSQEYVDAVEGGLNGIYYMIRSGDLNMYNN